MSLSMSQNYTALGPGLPAYFLATGGTSPYAYSVVTGGAGGTINPTTGAYLGPASIDPSPAEAYDTIQVTDHVGTTVSSQILIGNPLILLLDILQNQLQLDNAHVYLYDQKIFQPTDSRMYAVVSVVNCKPFANDIQYSASSGLSALQSINMSALIDIDIISRSTEALWRKEEVVMALNSFYSEQQQEACSFYLSQIPISFINLSGIDGAAIPYHFKISLIMQYFVTKSIQVGYFGTFPAAGVATNP